MGLLWLFCWVVIGCSISARAAKPAAEAENKVQNAAYIKVRKFPTLEDMTTEGRATKVMRGILAIHEDLIAYRRFISDASDAPLSDFEHAVCVYSSNQDRILAKIAIPAEDSYYMEGRFLEKGVQLRLCCMDEAHENIRVYTCSTRFTKEEIDFYFPQDFPHELATLIADYCGEYHPREIFSLYLPFLPVAAVLGQRHADYWPVIANYALHGLIARDTDFKADMHHWKAKAPTINALSLYNKTAKCNVDIKYSAGEYHQVFKLDPTRTNDCFAVLHSRTKHTDFYLLSVRLAIRKHKSENTISCSLELEALGNLPDIVISDKEQGVQLSGSGHLGVRPYEFDVETLRSLSRATRAVSVSIPPVLSTPTPLSLSWHNVFHSRFLATKKLMSRACSFLSRHKKAAVVGALALGAAGLAYWKRNELGMLLHRSKIS